MLKPIPSMKVQVRCKLGRRFPGGGGTIAAGRYVVHPIPTIPGGEQEGILEFQEPERHTNSHPEAEGEMLLAFLGLLLNCEVRKTGFSINGIDISQDQKVAELASFDSERLGQLEFSSQLDQLLRLSDTLVQQFVRAIKAYGLALHASKIDITLTFLLLTTSIECLSSQEEIIPNDELNKSQKSTERFCRFIGSYCDGAPTYYGPEGEPGFISSLKTIYYVHRSAFVHSGREVSLASSLADRAGYPALSHIENGKEVRTPGLKWFFAVVRATLLGFLAASKKARENPDPNVLSEIARQSAILTMRAA